jgi:hypothetical protein
VLKRAFVLLAIFATSTACPDEPDETFPDATGTVIDSGVVNRDAAAPDAVIFEDASEDAGLEPDADQPDATEPNDGEPFAIKVAYSATADDPLLEELYLTDTSTSRKRVNLDLAGGPAGGEKEPETAGIQSFWWSSDGALLLYEAQQDTYDVVELYAVDAPGAFPGVPRKLNPDATSDVSAEGMSAVSPLISFRHAIGNNTKLFVANATAADPNPRQISQGLPLSVSWSPANDHLALQDIGPAARDRGFWFVDARPGAPSAVRAYPETNLGSNGTVSWAPDGSAFVFTTDPGGDLVNELFRVSVSNGLLGAPERLHPDLGMTADVSGAAYSPDGTRVAYSANPRVDQLFELFVVDLSGAMPSLPISVSSTAATGRGVERLAWTPNGDHLIYVSDIATFGVFELFLADPTGATPAVRLNPPLGNGAVERETFARNGQTVVFLVNESDIRQIYAVDISGSTPSAPVRISEVNEHVPEFEVSSDGLSLIYKSGFSDSWSLGAIDLSVFPPRAPVSLYVGIHEPAWCFGNNDDAAVAADLDVDGDVGLFYVRNLKAPTFEKVSGPLIEDGRVRQCAFPPE